MSGFLIIQTTVDDRDAAETIARAAIERRLGACARIYEARSVYRWAGEVASADEFVVEIKTTEAARGPLEAVIAGLHPYELPEIVALPILGGSDAYLDWLSGEVSESL